MKKLFLVLAGLLVLALGLIIVLILRFDPEVLGERLIHEVNRQSGIRLQAEKFALHPLRGLELTNAQASGRVEAGDLSASIALLRLDYRVWPLLRGELWLDEVMLVEPRIELRSRSAEEVRQQKQRKQTKKERRGDRKSPGKERSGTSAEASEPPQGRPLELSIERLTVEDGMLAVRSEDGEQTRFLAADLRLILEGLSFEPEAPSSIEAVSGRGKLATGRLVHGELEATKAGGRIEVAGGEVVLTEVNVQSANADLMIPRLRIRLTQEPPSYQLDAAGGLDLNGILGVDGGGDGFGPVAVDLAAEGEGPDLSEMIGAGTLSLRKGSLPGLSSVVQIEELVGQRLLTGRKYEKSQISYRIADSRILLDPFEIESEGAWIGGTGEIHLTGSVDLEVFLRLPRRDLTAQELDSETLDAASDGRGMVTLPFHVGGTVSEPQVALTWEGVQSLAKDAARSWVEEVLEDAKRKAEDWLRSQSDEKDDG